MILFWCVLLPFITGLLCWQGERIAEWIPRWLAVIGIGIFFILVLFIYKKLQFASFVASVDLPQWQIEFYYSWIERFGISIHLALDGLSFLMILLATFLGFFSILCSWKEIHSKQGLFYLNVLFILGGSVGLFIAVDLFLFFFFWEIVSVPMYFLISLWGFKGSNVQSSIRAATKFFIYSQISGFLMLVSILGLAITYHNVNNIWTFSYSDLLCTPMSEKIEFLLMLGFFLAFAIKMPIVPLHGWLPDVHVQSPTAGSVDLAGILLKTSIYGLLRFNITLFPHASKQFSFIAMCFGIFNIFYGAWTSFLQTDIKKFIAYVNISHMGFLLIAIYSASHLAYQGIVLQIISYSISSAGMFIICGQLYERLCTRNMSIMGGLWNKLDLIPALSLFFSIAMLGLPGTGNFAGEISVLFGCFQVEPIVAVILSFSFVFSSVYSIILIQRIYFGEQTFLVVMESNNRMTLREKFIIITLAFSLLLIGCYPKLISDSSSLVMSGICNLLIMQSY
ncbi:NADH-quinone oxidoreductase subunit M [Blochmannia endosymbiont of Colobopsis nipponica]|uniref:NADH-quinone oxidoreductase subunit M n=1 Tax=Blochmannia endosymbiont of Colobopsis nipponica TaxID=2681987 RepID=UPI00177E704F|nr:NADH-quinone oxidoreductase subunit M [Blochmannia endosymbiont of Colobopsis nipponica]QOI10983.1 NADH-quinone oxidoreductase subunit M [Blochmannia endosymbiont of Colobopsis nipponica]